MARILVVCGHRALAKGGPGGGTAASERWARNELWARICAPRGPQVIFTGHCPKSPDAWAEQVAELTERRWVGYATNGQRYASDGAARPWYTGEPLYVQHRRFPLLRNFVEVGAAACAADPVYAGLGGVRAHDVRVVGLLTRWSPTHGSEHTLRLAEAAGLPTEWVYCPEHFRGDPGAGEHEQPDPDESEKALAVARASVLMFATMRAEPRAPLTAPEAPARDAEGDYLRERARAELERCNQARALAFAVARDEDEARERAKVWMELDEPHAGRVFELAMRELLRKSRCVAPWAPKCAEEGLEPTRLEPPAPPAAAPALAPAKPKRAAAKARAAPVADEATTPTVRPPP